VKYYILRYTDLFVPYGITPQQWKESINVPVYKKGKKNDYNNYRRISLFPTAYRILSIIILGILNPYVSEITGDYQCEFRRNRSTTDQIFYIHQIPEKNGRIMGWCISYLLISREPMIHLRENYFNISDLNLI
jgi:hypothetical protein